MPIVPVINVFTEKTVPVDADLVLIEDSADSNAKKKVQRGFLKGAQDHIALIEQTASISATNFTNSQTAGRYRVTYTLQCTTADERAVSVKATFAWTDNNGAASVDSDTLVLTARGRTTGTVIVQVASGAFTYATTVDTIGTAQYALYADVEKIS